MSERDRIEPVRFLTRKQDISDADFVYVSPGKSSRQRYDELVEAFLIRLERRRDEQKSESVSEA